MWSDEIPSAIPDLGLSKMHLVATYLGLVSAVLAAEEKFIERRAIPTGTFNDLVSTFNTRHPLIPPPVRNRMETLVLQFSNIITDTQGFIARDDNRKDIVVALRGSTSLTDFLVDVQIQLIPYVSHGVKPPCKISMLYFNLRNCSWNSVASEVLSTLGSQLAAHPGYALVSTGHSLGGALSSLAGVSLKENFPNSPVRMFTYGQPRTFDPIAANFVNSIFGSSAFRSVHTTDGVPTIIPRAIGYQHHGIEFFQTPDPATPSTTKQCEANGEDPTCSDSIPFMGIDTAHLTYFNIASSTAFCA